MRIEVDTNVIPETKGQSTAEIHTLYFKGKDKKFLYIAELSEPIQLSEHVQSVTLENVLVVKTTLKLSSRNHVSTLRKRPGFARGKTMKLQVTLNKRTGQIQVNIVDDVREDKPMVGYNVKATRSNIDSRIQAGLIEIPATWDEARELHKEHMEHLAHTNKVNEYLKGEVSKMIKPVPPMRLKTLDRVMALSK